MASIHIRSSRQAYLRLAGSLDASKVFARSMQACASLITHPSRRDARSRCSRAELNRSTSADDVKDRLYDDVQPAVGLHCESFTQYWRILTYVLRTHPVPHGKNSLSVGLQRKESVEFQLRPSLREETVAQDDSTESRSSKPVFDFRT